MARQNERGESKRRGGSKTRRQIAGLPGQPTSLPFYSGLTFSIFIIAYVYTRTLTLGAVIDNNKHASSLGSGLSYGCKLVCRGICYGVWELLVFNSLFLALHGSPSIPARRIHHHPSCRQPVPGQPEWTHPNLPPFPIIPHKKQMTPATSYDSVASLPLCLPAVLGCRAQPAGPSWRRGIACCHVYYDWQSSGLSM